MKPSLFAVAPVLALLLAAGSAQAAGGNFMSSCEADVFDTSQKLGVAPSLYAPGTDGPNTTLATNNPLASGQNQARVLGLPGPIANPAPPGERTDQIQALLTSALVAARRNDDFLCRARLQDAVRVAGGPSADRPAE